MPCGAHMADRSNPLSCTLQACEDGHLLHRHELWEFATHAQLREHELLDRDGHAEPPWHKLQATRDASTLWYALMRKRTRGIWSVP
jgi:hypothetical protein